MYTISFRSQMMSQQRAVWTTLWVHLVTPSFILCEHLKDALLYNDQPGNQQHQLWICTTEKIPVLVENTTTTSHTSLRRLYCAQPLTICTAGAAKSGYHPGRPKAAMWATARNMQLPLLLSLGSSEAKSTVISLGRFSLIWGCPVRTYPYWSVHSPV